MNLETPMLTRQVKQLLFELLQRISQSQISHPFNYPIMDVLKQTLLMKLQLSIQVSNSPEIHCNSVTSFLLPVRGRNFVPFFCHQLTKTGHIWGNVAIVKSCYLTDIITLVCCSLSPFTHYIRLLISRFGVRVPAGAPALPTDYRDFLFQ